VTYLNNNILYGGCILAAKINRSWTAPVLFEKLQCMERNGETQVNNMTTFAEISAIKKNG
jgi:hypothetical protein